MTIEEQFKELDNILAKMENNETTLEESFACYEQGMRLLKDAHASLDEVEKKIEILGKDNAANVAGSNNDDEGLPF